LKDLKNKIEWLLSRQEVNFKSLMMFLWHQSLVTGYGFYQ
jgi:hypothetical protein